MKAYDNYIFDLYGTLVDIHTEENDPLVWKKLALFYGYYDADYSSEELKERYAAIIAGEEYKMKSEKKDDAHVPLPGGPEPADGDHPDVFRRVSPVDRLTIRSGSRPGTAPFRTAIQHDLTHLREMRRTVIRIAKSPENRVFSGLFRWRSGRDSNPTRAVKDGY